MCLFVGLNKPICIKCLYHSLTYGEHRQILEGLNLLRAFQVALVTKNLPANAGGARDMGSIPGSGRSPGEGTGNPLHYSCLENPMEGGAW